MIRMTGGCNSDEIVNKMVENVNDRYDYDL